MTDNGNNNLSFNRLGRIIMVQRIIKPNKRRQETCGNMSQERNTKYYIPNLEETKIRSLSQQQRY